MCAQPSGWIHTADCNPVAAAAASATAAAAAAAAAVAAAAVAVAAAVAAASVAAVAATEAAAAACSGTTGPATARWCAGADALAGWGWGWGFKVVCPRAAPAPKSALIQPATVEPPGARSAHGCWASQRSLKASSRTSDGGTCRAW